MAQIPRPKPPQPRRRREPPPWHRPKPAEEDPDAPRRVRAIFASSSYRQANEDVEFLHRDDTRGLRLQLDYLKAELLLEQRANRGAFDVGATSIGMNISLPHEQYPNPYITPDLCFRFHYFALRKLHFLRAFDPDFLMEEGVIDREDVELFWFAETAEEIWAAIGQWYSDAGEGLA